MKAMGMDDLKDAAESVPVLQTAYPDLAPGPAGYEVLTLSGTQTSEKNFKDVASFRKMMDFGQSGKKKRDEVKADALALFIKAIELEPKKVGLLGSALSAVHGALSASPSRFAQQLLRRTEQAIVAANANDSYAVGPQTFRVAPVYVELRGMNDATLNGTKGWAFKRLPNDSFGVKFENLTEKSVCRRNLQVAIQIEAPLDTRSWSRPIQAEAKDKARCTILPARAGDFLHGSVRQQGFFVYYPGARVGRNAHRLREFPALRVCAADIGQWGSAMHSELSVHDVKLQLQQMKPQKRLPAHSWDPLHGPGWPGVYTDRRLEGIRLAPEEDVVELSSWSEAIKCWTELTRLADDWSQGYVAPFRTAISDETKLDDVENAMRWYLAKTEFGKTMSSSDGVAFCGAHIEEEGSRNPRYAFVLLSNQGGFSTHDFEDSFVANPMFKFELNGQPLVFSKTPLCDGPTKQPAMKKIELDWASRKQSADGTLTCERWWYD
jgi:hypothetical protein